MANKSNMVNIAFGAEPERIELREVEVALLKAPGVDDACCLAVCGECGDDVWWVAAVAGDGLNEKTLQGHLSEHLPVAFVPAMIGVFRALPSLPRERRIDRDYA